LIINRHGCKTKSETTLMGQQTTTEIRSNSNVKQPSLQSNPHFVTPTRIMDGQYIKSVRSK